MGYHNTIFEVDSFQKGDPVKISGIKESKFISSDCHASGCRHIFYESLFDSKSCVKTSYLQETESFCYGYLDSRTNAMRNLTKFIVSKRNPFLSVPYFKEASQEFVRRARSLKSKFLFYCLSDSLLESFNLSERVVRKTVLKSTYLYEAIRSQSKLSPKKSKIALVGTHFVMKDPETIILDPDLEEDMRSAGDLKRRSPLFAIFMGHFGTL